MKLFGMKLNGENLMAVGMALVPLVGAAHITVSNAKNVVAQVKSRKHVEE